MPRRSSRLVGLTARRSLLRLEVLEDRTVPNAVSWTLGANGDFANAAGWTDQAGGSHHVPGPGDDADAGGFTLTSSVDEAVASLNNAPNFQIAAGTFTISGSNRSQFGSLEVAAGATLSVGSGGYGADIDDGQIFGTLNVAAGSILNLSAGTLIGRLNNAGTVNQGTLIGGNGLLTNEAGGTYVLENGSIFNGTVNNVGLFVSDDAYIEPNQVVGPFTNTGTVRIDVGKMLVGDGSTGVYTQTDGLTTIGDFAGSFQTGTIQLNGGTLSGSGQFIANVIGGGTISLGSGLGQLTIHGNLNLTGSLAIELNGSQTELDVTGTVTLGGALNLAGADPFPIGTRFDIIDSLGTRAVNGTFAGLPEGATISAGGQDFKLSYHGGDGNDATLTAVTGPPTSTVFWLPPASPRTFMVRWSGSDTGGPGIAYYDIYVSHNSGPFTSVLTHTTRTSASFTGQLGIEYQFYSVATDNAGNVQRTPSGAQATTAIEPDADAGIHAVGSGPGGPPVVKVYNGVGTLLLSFNAYAAGFTGGVNVAVGDVTGDGVPDVVTGAGPGGGPQVKVFDGSALVVGNPLLFDSFYAYAVGFQGGVRVATGDVRGDDIGDIITGAGPGGGPQVKIFERWSSQAIASFYAYPPSFTGGVFVAAGDVNEDGRADVITGAGAGGGPHVEVFDGAALAAGGSVAQAAINKPLRSFFAYGTAFTGGVSVAAGDVNADGHDDIITGAGHGGGPQVKVFSGADASLIANFFAYDPSFSGGVDVAAADVNIDGHADIITGTGRGGGPHIKVFSGTDRSVLASFFAFDPTFLGGLFVG